MKKLIILLAILSIGFANEKNWFTSANIAAHLPGRVVTDDYKSAVILRSTLAVHGQTSLNSLNVPNSVTASLLTDGTGVMTGGVVTGLSALTATALTGTLQTAAQTNVTSVGVLNGVVVTGAGVSTNALHINGSATITGTQTVTGLSNLGNMTASSSTINGVVIGRESGSIIASDTIYAASLNVTGIVTANNVVSKFKGYEFNFTTPANGESIVFNGGDFVNKTVGAVGAGVGIYYYLDDNKNGVFTTWNTLQITPDTTTAEDIDTINVSAATSPVLYGYYVTNPLGITKITAGEWLLNLYDYVDSQTGVSTISVNFYSVTPLGVKTALFSMTSGEINHTVVQLETIRSIQPDITLLSTDSILIEVYAKTTSVGDRVVSFIHNGTTHYTNLRLPTTAEHNLLAGLQGGTTATYYHSNQAINTNSNVVFGNVSSSGMITANYAVIVGDTVAPAAIEGTIYYNTSTKKMMFYNGTAYIDMGIMY